MKIVFCALVVVVMTIMCTTLCAKEAYEKYAVNDLPKVRDYGFFGLHYVDELTSEPILHR